METGAVEAIRRLERSWEEAWNRHDSRALAELLEPDGDFVTVLGTWLRGREEFEQHHRRLHAAQFRDSVWKVNEVHVRFIQPRLAISHVEWQIDGDRDPDDTPRKQTRRGLFTRVLVQRDRDWRIIASHNTNVMSQTETG